MPSRRTKLQMFIQISNIDILISSGFSIYTLGKAHMCFTPPSLPCCLSNSSTVGLDDDGVKALLSRSIVERFLFLHPSTPGS